MTNSLRKIIAEYKLYVDNVHFEIRGRILKELEPNTDFPYSLEISHYCKTNKNAATTYRPSRTLGKTEKEVTDLLFLYFSTFSDIEIEINEAY